MSRIRLSNPDLPPSLRGWCLINQGGRPRFWAVVWADILRAASHGTLAGELAHIERFYRAVERVQGSDQLDRLLAAGEVALLEDALRGFLAELQNEGARSGRDLSSAWRTVLRFVTSILRHLGPPTAAKAGHLEARLLQLEALFSQLSPSRPRAASPIRALPAAILEDLRLVFSPTSNRNPFRPKQRARNELLFLLYLRLGLRRGEALMLGESSFREEMDPITGRRSRWVDVATLEGEDDPRSLTPSLKTPQSARPLPLTAETYELVLSYASNWRRGAEHRFLFHSQKGGPLAAQTVGDVFTTASGALSERAKAELARRRDTRVTPHDLRHTACVLRLKRHKEEGLSTDDALGKLRAYFGWSVNSAMPHLYARAYWQTEAGDASDARFEAELVSLRSLDMSLEGRPA